MQMSNKRQESLMQRHGTTGAVGAWVPPGFQWLLLLCWLQDRTAYGCIGSDKPHAVGLTHPLPLVTCPAAGRSRAPWQAGSCRAAASASS